MKRFILAAGSLLSLCMAGIIGPTPSAPSQQMAEVVDVANSKAAEPITLAQKHEMGQVMISQRPEVGYFGQHFKDVSGPRRVRYGKGRWIQLT